MRFVVGFTFFLITQISFAQFPFELWHEGKVVLLSGDTLEGAIKYDLDRDIIQLNDTKTIEAYTARKVLYFNIFDETVNQYRQFYAIPFNVTPDYKAPLFFEVFYEGRVTLLGREYIKMKTTGYGPGVMGSAYSRPILAYHFYFLDNVGQIVVFNSNKKELLRYFQKFDDEIDDYMKRNHLRHDKKSDLIQIVHYYNTLIKPKNE